MMMNFLSKYFENPDLLVYMIINVLILAICIKIAILDDKNLR